MKRILRLALAATILCSVVTTPLHAATRRDVPGATYGENLPSGEFAALEGGVSVLTHLGEIPLPPRELAVSGLGPLYLRITNVGGFKFGGQSHAGLGTWLWTTKGWDLLGPACGVSPFIFNAAGEPQLSNCSIGSQGWRYVADDGKLVTGDETYGDAARNVWEYTTHGGITVGQGGNGGCVAIRGADRRLLEPGDCRFVRFNLSGSRMAVAMSKFTENKVVFLWLDVSELNTFPIDVLPSVAVKAPVVAPVVTAQPAIGTLPDHCCAGPNMLATVEAVRRKYPTPLGALHGYFLIEVAQAVGGKLFIKNGGDHITLYTGDNVSQDIVIVGTEWVDILGDAENTARPSWDAHPNATCPCLDVTGLRTSPVLPTVLPPPVVVTVPVDTVTQAQLRAAITQLHTDLWAEVSGSINEQRSVLERLIAEVNARLTQLESRPVDTVNLGAAIDAALVNYEVNGKTKTDRLGLQHVVQLPITKRK